MLRPATPLSILLFAAFILLLLSVLSTPIIKGIPLASYEGTDYGQDKEDDADYDLSSSARHTLSSILIVHPVAALLTLICLVLALAAHLHAPSHSPRYLLALLILLIPTVLVSLLAFLVDILLFVPHLQWGGWIVLAATIILTASGVVACAMQRTLVSRKARKKRIAENAEMNGENFYSRQNTGPVAVNTQPVNPANPPMINGGPGADKLPAFATFETSQTRRVSDEEATPLNNRSPSTRTATITSSPPGLMDDQSERYGDPAIRRGPSAGRNPPYNGPRDEFGNPLPPSAAFGPPPVHRQPSDPRFQPPPFPGNGRGGPPPGFRGRGRGGYPPRGGYGIGRGGPYGGAPRGPPPFNGGRGMPNGVAMAAGAGASMMAGDMMNRGPPRGPPGYDNDYPPQGRDGPGFYPPPGPNMPPGVYARRSPAPQGPGSDSQGYGYSRSPPNVPPTERSVSVPLAPPMDGSGSAQDSPADPQEHDRSPHDAEVGQAVEMDASTGTHFSMLSEENQPNNLRESDADIQGMIGMQQQRQGSPRQGGVVSPTSMYSQQTNSQYLAPRADWAAARNPSSPTAANANHKLSPILSSPVELPGSDPTSPPQSPHDARSPPSRGSGEDYYEDVDPRFVEPTTTQVQHPSALPAALMPGRTPIDSLRSSDGFRASSSYEDITVNDGPRSPAGSEISHFTSISQREVNPRWRPGPPSNGMNPGPPPGMLPPRRAVPQTDILGNNPDFEIPGMRGRGMRGGRGVGPSLAAPGGRYPVRDI
ncbi:MAG: regulator of ime2 [Cirrosporium novae-zelandiae]|nr:MAG: regulator of ime2 [Cirrosporium novae-zelandiae]